MPLGRTTPQDLDDDLVTVVIPARNEERFIGACLDSVLAQDERNLQVIVIDGASDDATAEIVRARAAEDPRVELVENPDRLIPIGLNRAVDHTRGRWLVRIDAHATVPPDYVSRAVAHLKTGRWGGVGGRKDGVGKTPAGVAIAAAMQSRFGVGGSTYHHGTHTQTVEHIPFGAYPTEVIRELGGWNEDLAVNQDFEFDLRVRQSGRELLFDPELVIWWHCRQSVKDLYGQYKRYGRGKVRVASLYPESMRIRHLLPPALVAWLGLAALVGLRKPKVAAAAVAPYVAGLAIAGRSTAGSLPAESRRFAVPAFAAMHVGWGLGFWRGVIDLFTKARATKVVPPGGTSAGPRKPRVVVVAQASPAQGGIASFAETVVADTDLAESFDVELLNTTRRAVREGGTPTFENAKNALVDTVRAYRAGRKADIVHVQTALMPALPLARAVAVCGAARLAGARVLCHVHSGRVNSGQAEAFDPGSGMKLALRSLQVAHGVLTCADRGTSRLREIVPGLDVETVDNAVEVSDFHRADFEPGGEVRIMFLGTLSKRKGVRDLLDAVVLLRQRGVTGWSLELVGGAAEVGEGEAGELRQAYVDAGFGDSLVGPLHGEPLRKRLSEADIFVLPSHWEGQPISILEAMASGLPIVASTVGAVPDVVRDGVEGLLIEPHDSVGLADALERLITSPDLRAQMGVNARARVEDRHDRIHLSRRLEDVYRRALAS